MKRLILIGILLVAGYAYPQSYFQQFLDSVNSAHTDSAKTALIDSFIAHSRSIGIPFIEDSVANFIYRGKATSVNLRLIGMTGYENINLYRLSNTDFFYYSKVFELDARFEYIFTVNSIKDTSSVVDPENPKLVYWWGYPTSELAMPRYVYPQEIIFNPSIPHGTLRNHEIYSTALNATYLIQVYLPPGYESTPSQRFPSLYINDGQYAADTLVGATTIVLDNLIHQSKIKKIISVFISSDSKTRGVTYIGEKRFDYENFIINTVVTFVDSLYRTVQDPGLRGILGTSAGGLISTQIAYNNPLVFGLCAPLSPSYWANDKEVHNMIVRQAPQKMKFYLEWGTYEPKIAVLARSLKDSLIAKGYNVKWNEWHEGHTPGCWRAHQDNLLEFLFPVDEIHVKKSPKK